MAMSRKAWAKLIGIAVCIILAIVLLLINRGELGKGVQINLLLFSLKMSGGVFAILMFLIGVLTGMFTAFYVNARRRRTKE